MKKQNYTVPAVEVTLLSDDSVLCFLSAESAGWGEEADFEDGIDL